MLKKAVSLLAALAMGVSSIVMAAPVFAADGFDQQVTVQYYGQSITFNNVKLDKETVTVSGEEDAFTGEITVATLPSDCDMDMPMAYFYGKADDGTYFQFNGVQDASCVVRSLFEGVPYQTQDVVFGSMEYIGNFDSANTVLFRAAKDSSPSGPSGPADTAGPSGSDSEGPSSPADTTGPSAGNTSSGGGTSSGGDVQYTVKQWDTLGHLSVNYYGNYNYHQAIYDANKEAFAKTGGKVVPGMVLTLPAKIGDTSILAPAKAAMGEKLYTVKSGESLGSIAASYYGSSKKSKEIFERNKDRLKDEVTLYEGQIIVLPKMEGKWQKSGDNWSYVLDTGKKLANQWQWIDGSWYRFNGKGVMATGWQKVNGIWYYLQDDGAMLSNGWYTINKEEYYLNASGEMETGWLQLGNTWYYLQPKTGEKLSGGWEKIGGKWYYFYADGSMAADTTVDGYTVGKDGAWVK